MKNKSLSQASNPHLIISIDSEEYYARDPLLRVSVGRVINVQKKKNKRIGPSDRFYVPMFLFFFFFLFFYSSKPRCAILKEKESRKPATKYVVVLD